MADGIEREIKLRYDTRDAARAAVDGLRASPLRGRRLQDDRLLDLPDGDLRDRRCTLRIRIESPVEGKSVAATAAATVTFKGPPLPDVMKVREEIETAVGDGNLLLRIFEKAGWQVWFRYQKYREEFAQVGVVIAIDETPIGTFVELEGDERGVARLAAALGRTTDHYIVGSYRSLYIEHCSSTGRSVSHMVFR